MNTKHAKNQYCVNCQFCPPCGLCNKDNNYDMFEAKEIKTNLRAIHYKSRPLRYKVRTDASHQCIKNKHYATE